VPAIEHPLLLLVISIACIPIYDAWAWLLFGSRERALSALRWVFRSDWKSLWRGEFGEDQFAEYRLAALVGLSALSVAAFYYGIAQLLG
jgi:hypothetical protein